LAYRTASWQPQERQVLISNTGRDKDARTFAASVFKLAMEAAGLNTCVGSNHLHLGCEWPQELVEAAANSMVVVAMLSRTYTNQLWCMLELDQALHSRRQQLGEQDRRAPLVIPVFCDSPDATIDPDAIEKRWFGDLGPQLKCVDEEVGPERAGRVDASHWAANIITAIKDVFQHLRRKLVSADDKDEQTPMLAARVVSEAVKHVPQVLDVGAAAVVGFEEQEELLAAELDARLGLWLYGHGAYCCCFIPCLCAVALPVDPVVSCMVLMVLCSLPARYASLLLCHGCRTWCVAQNTLCICNMRFCVTCVHALEAGNGVLDEHAL
jgi:hypothetical protein